MQQIVTIHGGDTYRSYEDYLAYLRVHPLTLEEMERKGWRSGLGTALGAEYRIISPRMPNALNARYPEWKLWMDKVFPLLSDDVILLGHSLGATFLVKYLAEAEPVRKVKATFLIAPPYDESTKPNEVPRKYLDGFLPPKDKSAFVNHSGKLFIYHSEDDDVVPFSSLADYQRDLPDATCRTFKDRGHFLQEEFPELVQDILSLR